MICYSLLNLAKAINQTSRNNLQIYDNTLWMIPLIQHDLIFFLWGTPILKYYRIQSNAVPIWRGLCMPWKSALLQM